MNEQFYRRIQVGSYECATWLKTSLVAFSYGGLKFLL